MTQTWDQMLFILKSARAYQGLSRDCIATYAGSSITSISRWESGKNRGQIDKLIRWAAALGYVLKLEKSDAEKTTG